ncbi:MAG: hypothetical protein Cons2KO_33210 [Congregibacter sp.]
MDAIAIGLDDGYAVTKVALATGQLFAVPSKGRIGGANVTAVNRSDTGVSEYVSGDEHIAVGVADGESTSFEDYPFSSLNRAIVQHALLGSGLSGASIHAVSGLPVARFYHSDGQRRDELIARKSASLLEPVQPLDGRSPVSIACHDVIPEALAAWYDHVIVEHEGDVRVDDASVKAPLAIVDIGGRTTDFVVVADEKLWHQSSGSMTCGLLDLRIDIAGAICAAYDLDSLSDIGVDQALTKNTVRLFGEDRDVSALVIKARQQIVLRIEQEARRRLGRGAELDRVLFVGGGSVVLAHAIRNWFPNQTIAAHPAFANARGMLKYHRYVGVGSE